MQRLRHLREDRDLRQSDVARATGLDQKTLSNYETGKTNPDSYALIKLADFFGVTIDYLVERTDNNFLDKEKIRGMLDEIQKDIDELKQLL